MNVDDEAIQLGLLPNMNTPVSKLGQRQRATNNVTGVKERDLAARTQKQLLLPSSINVDEDEQGYPDSVTEQLTSSWERSQEFEINVRGQIVRVNFRAFYFSRSMGCGVHHFEFYGHSISPTGYRSDFLQASLIDSWSSPSAYALARAQELHSELLKKQGLQLHSY